MAKCWAGWLAAGMMAASGGLSGAVVELPDNAEALINPDMGWTMHFYSNQTWNYGSRLAPADTLDWFEGCSVVYLRIPWAFIEPEEGHFEWSILDTPAQRWIAGGKQVAFRFTTAESWLEYPTPKWVFDAGAKYVRFTPGEGPQATGEYVAPVFDDPIFLEKLGNFLAAAGARYDDNPNVAFIDVGTFGTWGEGHTGFSQRLDDAENVRLAGIHLDLHKKYFPRTQLVISDDVIGAERPGDDFPLMRYARSQNVSLRDDSILVQGGDRAWFHAGLAQQFWPTLPVVLEHEHFAGSVERGCWDSELLKKAVEEYHASYLSIHGWPDELWEKEKEAVRAINRRLGYRFNLPKIAYPDTVRPGEPAVWRYDFANVGVAPCYRDAFVSLTLKDGEGGIAAVLVDEFNGRNLEPAEPGKAVPVERAVRFTINQLAPRLAPGEYEVFVSVGRLDGTPVYALPYPGNDGQRRYRIGCLTVPAE